MDQTKITKKLPNQHPRLKMTTQPKPQSNTRSGENIATSGEDVVGRDLEHLERENKIVVRENDVMLIRKKNCKINIASVISFKYITGFASTKSSVIDIKKGNNYIQHFGQECDDVVCNHFFLCTIMKNILYNVIFA